MLHWVKGMEVFNEREHTRPRIRRHPLCPSFSQKLKNLNPLKFEKKIAINLYGGEMADKEVLVFKN